MRHVVLVVPFLLLGCSPPPESPPVDLPPVDLPLEVATATATDCALLLERRLRSGDGAVCLTPFSPGSQPYVIETADRWAVCGSGLTIPCEDETVCSHGDCACTCKHDGDCRASAVAAAQMHYAGMLPSGVTTWCEAGRCVWSAR